MAGVDEPADELGHLDDVAGGPRLDRGRQDVERLVGGAELALEQERVRPPRPALLGRLREDLVVDVGDVADVRDLVAVRDQPAAQDVEGDLGADVAEVRRALGGGAADVDTDLALGEGNEVSHLSGVGVEKSECHLTIVLWFTRPEFLLLRCRF